MNTTNELPLSTVLRLSLSNNDTVMVSFKKKDGTPTYREVTTDPVFVKQLGGNLPKGIRHTAKGYICAFDIAKNDHRQFRLDRIEKAEVVTTMPSAEATKSSSSRAP